MARIFKPKIFTEIIILDIWYGTGEIGKSNATFSFEKNPNFE